MEIIREINNHVCFPAKGKNPANVEISQIRQVRVRWKNTEELLLRRTVEVTHIIRQPTRFNGVFYSRQENLYYNENNLLIGLRIQNFKVATGGSLTCVTVGISLWKSKTNWLNHFVLHCETLNFSKAVLCIFPSIFLKLSVSKMRLELPTQSREGSLLISQPDWYHSFNQLSLFYSVLHRMLFFNRLQGKMLKTSNKRLKLNAIFHCQIKHLPHFFLYPQVSC